MDQKLIDKIELYFNALPKGIAMRGASITDDEIKFTEKELDVKLNQEFIDFVKLYNESYVNIDFFSVKQENKYNTIINVTKDARTNYKLYRGKVLNKGVVIADDGAGNPFVISEDGKVMIFYHDCDEYKILASSFSKFLEGAIEGTIKLY